jgi:hypothetical protein
LASKIPISHEKPRRDILFRTVMFVFPVDQHKVAWQEILTWNPCCGQGTPMGNALLQSLGGVAAFEHAQQGTGATRATIK